MKDKKDVKVTEVGEVQLEQMFKGANSQTDSKEDAELDKLLEEEMRASK